MSKRHQVRSRKKQCIPDYLLYYQEYICCSSSCCVMSLWAVSLLLPQHSAQRSEPRSHVRGCSGSCEYQTPVGLHEGYANTMLIQLKSFSPSSLFSSCCIIAGALTLATVVSSPSSPPPLPHCCHAIVAVEGHTLCEHEMHASHERQVIDMHAACSMSMS